MKYCGYNNLKLCQVERLHNILNANYTTDELNTMTPRQIHNAAKDLEKDWKWEEA